MKARIRLDSDIIPDTDIENSERSRSFLFFSLAAIAASGLRHPTTIYVPENAIISLNVPLDPLRLGSLSTRTTHPYFMARFNEVLRQLSIKAQLDNPYRHKSKGDMVRECLNQGLLAASVANTMSCASPTKGRYKHLSTGHCGYCVPCIIRRAAMLGWQHPDPTVYSEPIVPGRRLNSKRAAGEHVRSFQLAIHRLNDSMDRAKVLIHKSGPLTDHASEIPDFARAYLASMREVAALLRGVRTSPNA